MQDWIQNNFILFITLFIAIVVIIVIIRIIAAVSGGKKKKAALADEDMVEVVFNGSVFPERSALTRAGLTGYEIFSVNGSAPRIIGSSLLVPSGKSLIDMQYMISGNSMGSRHANVFERQQVSFDFEKGKKYIVQYNTMTKEFSNKVL